MLLLLLLCVELSRISPDWWVGGGPDGWWEKGEAVGWGLSTAAAAVRWCCITAV